MYACVCNAVTDSQVKRAIADGATTINQLKAQLRVSTSCGACADHVENCLNEALSMEICFSDLAPV